MSRSNKKVSKHYENSKRLKIFYTLTLRNLQNPKQKIMIFNLNAVYKMRKHGQVFVVRLVCEKYLVNGKDVFWAFMDLEKAYDTIDRHGMWQMLRVYGVRGKLLKAGKSFYVDSRACVRVGNDVSEWFPVNVGLRQGCVMSPWLFN